MRRFARLLALLAIVAYQPLAALHAATDEAHLSHAAASGQVDRARQHDHGEHRHNDQRQPGHADHQFCGFCVTAGVWLLSPAATAAVVWAKASRARDFPVQPIRAEKRLKVGHPARAPPLTA